MVNVALRYNGGIRSSAEEYPVYPQLASGINDRVLHSTNVACTYRTTPYPTTCSSQDLKLCRILPNHSNLLIPNS